MGSQTRQVPSGVTFSLNSGTTEAASLNVPAGVAPRTPTNGDCWNAAKGWTCRINEASIAMPVTAPSRTGLAALHSNFGQVLRTGYFSEGDAPPLSYVASNASCSLNAGAGDNGAQVPTRDGKCWVAIFPTAGIDLVQFGAKCDGKTVDTVAVQRAVAYATTVAPAIIILPNSGLCLVNSTVTVPSGVGFRGQGTNFGKRQSGFITTNTALNPMFNLTGIGSSFRDMLIGGIVGATGTVIRFKDAATGQGVMENLFFYNTCNAVAVNGYQHRVSKVYIANSGGSACDAVTVGDSTTGSATTGTLLDHVSVYAITPMGGAAPRSCFHILDAGGVFITHSDAVKCFIGTWIAPASAGQSVEWLTASDTYLGDTNTGDALVIDAAASTTVRGLNFNGSWASSAASNGVRITSSGGTIRGLYFDGLRAFSNGGSGFNIASADPSQIYLTDSHICGYGSSGAGVYVVSGASNFTLSTTEIKPNCADRTSTGTIGVKLLGGNANVILTKLDTRGNSSGGILGSPTGSSIVEGLIDQDAKAIPLTAVASIKLGIWKNYTISGTTTVSNITGAWDGRQIMLFPSSPTPFATGGNICNAFTAIANVPIIAIYLGCWYLK